MLTHFPSHLHEFLFITRVKQVFKRLGEFSKHIRQFEGGIDVENNVSDLVKINSIEDGEISEITIYPNKQFKMYLCI